MAKKQVNMRISEMTRDKLDFLSTYYGTQAEAIAVAVDRLYQETRYGYGDYGMSDLQLVQEGKNEALQPAYANQHDTKIKVLLIEDVENISENIQKMLKHLEMELVGTAVTCEDGIEQATNLQPHIVLLNRA
ncbi:MAG: response regulator, partial [Chloroflexi bacterium]|nr:response regulator [Chloroflexota bacterium]